MVHRLQRFKTAYQQVEQIYAGASGTLAGVVGSSEFRNLQDIYVKKPSIRFQKPGFNARKWERYYENRYHPYKRKVKAEFSDLGIETSSSQPEALRTGEPSHSVGRSEPSNFYRQNSFSTYSQRRRRNRRRHHKSCICRNVGSRFRAFTRKRPSYHRQNPR